MDFPYKETVEKLEKQKKLKMKTAVTIEKGVWGPEIKLKGTSLYRWIGFMIGGTIAGLIVAHIWPEPESKPLSSIFVYFGGYLIGSIIGAVIGREWQDEYLGELKTDSEIFFTFLDKFAKDAETKITEKILFRKKRKVRNNHWKIGYGTLLAAYRLYKEDQPEFEKIVAKAGNKREFVMAVGVN